MAGPLLFGLLVGLAVLIGFVASWRILRTQDPLEARLRELGLGGKAAVAEAGEGEARKRPAWPTLTRLVAGFGFGPRLATSLARADMPLTAAEYTLLIAGAGLLGLLFGMMRRNLLLGILLALLLGYVPVMYLRFRQRRRLRAFTAQLPDVLTLLVGALRVGYGLSQALELLVSQLPPPASKEFGRVMRAIGVGLPVQTALRDMADRVDSDDLALVVTAVTVQYEMGGNLAQTLETISDTVRDRIRILQEIRVLTAQQRFTGYFLAVWPVVIAILLFLINPTYIRQLFQPGWVRLMPAAAVVLQVLGFIVIRRIVDIEV